MKKHILLLIVIIFIEQISFSLNNITTAESISWNGANCSVSVGFESMLYNPAGLYKTQKTFGINLLGSYAVRFYNNTFTTEEIIDNFFQKKDITEFLHSRINIMEDFYLDFDTGFDVSLFNIMIYKKFKKFSFGFYFNLKTYWTFRLSRNLLSALFYKIDLNKPFNINFSTTMMEYADFNFILSSRATFLENLLPFLNNIYGGVSLHIYVPTLFANLVASGELYSTAPSKDSLIPEVGYTYKLKLTGEGLSAGLFQSIIGNLADQGLVSKDLIPGQNLLNSLLIQKNAWGIGFGFDVGTIFVISKMLSIGLAITDLGFMIYPNIAKISYNKETVISTNKDISTELFGATPSEANTNDSALSLAPLAIRTGLGFSPIKSKFFDFSVALDISISDLQRLANIGEYPTFSFGFGTEFSPKIGWFKLPIIISANYNSQANNWNLSFGTGLYLGPVEMLIGIKGWHALIEDWGTNEIAIGLDFKYEF